MYQVKGVCGNGQGDLEDMASLSNLQRQNDKKEICMLITLSASVLKSMFLFNHFHEEPSLEIGYIGTLLLEYIFTHLPFPGYEFISVCVLSFLHNLINHSTHFIVLVYFKNIVMFTESINTPAVQLH